MRAQARHQDLQHTLLEPIGMPHAPNKPADAGFYLPVAARFTLRAGRSAQK